jgi:lipopolysaccharide transport system permease protein
VIRPRADRHAIDLAELLRYRELLFFLVWKDVLVRYKQTLLGVGWVLLQPILALALFSVVFGRLARIPSDGIPYAAFAFAGVVPWIYFSRVLLASPASLVSNPNLIRKVYFPRVLLPASVILGGLVDLLLGLTLLVFLIPTADLSFTLRIAALPLFLVHLAAVAFGVALWLSALNARYRDVSALIPFGVQIWMFASPVVYPVSLVPARWHALYALNPMVGVLEGFRWCLLGAGELPLLLVGLSFAVSAVIAATGLLYFQHSERVLADVL